MSRKSLEGLNCDSIVSSLYEGSLDEKNRGSDMISPKTFYEFYKTHVSECSIPIIIDPKSIVIGTGSFIRYRDNVYFISARHCFYRDIGRKGAKGYQEYKDFALDTMAIMVEPELTCPVFLPRLKDICIEGSFLEDCFGDIACVEIKDNYGETYEDVIVDLDDAPVEIDKDNDLVMFCGFPRGSLLIDLQAAEICCGGNVFIFLTNGFIVDQERNCTRLEINYEDAERFDMNSDKVTVPTVDVAYLRGISGSMVWTGRFQQNILIKGSLKPIALQSTVMESTKTIYAPSLIRHLFPLIKGGNSIY